MTRSHIRFHLDVICAELIGVICIKFIYHLSIKHSMPLHNALLTNNQPLIAYRFPISVETSFLLSYFDFLAESNSEQHIKIWRFCLKTPHCTLYMWQYEDISRKKRSRLLRASLTSIINRFIPKLMVRERDYTLQIAPFHHSVSSIFNFQHNECPRETTQRIS
ncbi:hypothetical protein ACJX0J_021761, partial [Zea mays]